MIAKSDDNVKKFKVYDFYHNPNGDVLGWYCSRHDAQRRVAEREAETKGECLCMIVEVML